MTPVRIVNRRPAALPALVCLALALALTGCSAESAPQAEDHGPAGTSAAAPEEGATAPGGAADSRDKGGKTVPAPVRVTIPSIGVDSELMRLGLNKDRTVEVPPAEKGMTAGWYTGAAVPGERGAAVIIGHNDTRHGAAVFHDLRKVGKGAEITVRNAAGGTARFKVTGTETVSKKAFPSQRVYGQPVNGRELRLITCDGEFDKDGHTVDNLIVYAKRG
ncbi:class F sortase [Streptomyces katsurahamanus]|uniref:Class F sortase n=1 Tax=Streptomyces katsurahamanus TaxID=2577098 RepID=A0ABW9NX91_9ACTN|nr:class F sortase [Streptomyces katsurahamanus]MQS37906.1 class F sortase [Streptomyces katsurahamanus]